MWSRDLAIHIWNQVVFREEPRREAYGTVAVFEDFFRNGWDLTQPADDILV